MIVADTGAILALVDTSDRHHKALLAVFEERPTAWILPWAILAEVDYLIGAHLGAKAQEAWLDDLASGAFQIEWGSERRPDARARDRATSPRASPWPRRRGRHGHGGTASGGIHRDSRSQAFRRRGNPRYATAPPRDL